MKNQLEIISRVPSFPTTRPTLLFIHGAFAGAWCWDEYFLPYFAQHGYPAHAMSLRGHGNSLGSELLLQASLEDYVDDVADVVKELPQPVVLIGHSMGGMVVQKYIELHPVKAMVLMNSVPPTGLSSSSVYLSFTAPFLVQQLGIMQTMGPEYIALSAVKKALFSDNVPDSEVQRFFRHMQGESQRVIMDMSGFNLPMLSDEYHFPILVLGAENDAFFPTTVVNSTARLYRADKHIFANTAHAMMLEKTWREVADTMIAWLQRRCR
jgi:pimeloyl-ACP methyl ester carboxylesterase